MKKISQLWEPIGKLDKKEVLCKICAHYCHIFPNKRGICQTRMNINGKLYTLIYGSCISRGSNDPIEKKPLYHFWPGSTAFSIATIGCNFHCKQCQNWEISQSHPDEEGRTANFSNRDQADFGIRSFPLVQMTPGEIIQNVKRFKSKSIAYTYNEPTIWFEFLKDTALLAKKEGIYNILVTNGFSSKEANEEYVKFIDAANVDIKSIEDSFYKKIVGVPGVQPVLDTCKFFKKHGIHLEITNLIIPGENDSTKQITQLIEWVLNNLGPDTPLHFSAYTPRYRLSNQPTPASILNQAWQIAKKAGMNYVYLGNVRTKEGNNTICPDCGNLIIERHGYNIKCVGLTPNKTCSKCGKSLNIIGNVLNT
ncbi:MAG: AmmeMemoRadiSam system radical SAM enzyme [Promethearchaeota archaeon]